MQEIGVENVPGANAILVVDETTIVVKASLVHYALEEKIFPVTNIVSEMAYTSTKDQDG